MPARTSGRREMRRERRLRDPRARLALALAAPDVALLALRTAVVKPSAAKVLALLEIRRESGVSPDDARYWAGCDRLASRIFDLRGEGIAIRHKDEPNANGGQHRRYFLVEPEPATPAATYAPGELMELWGK